MEDKKGFRSWFNVEQLRRQFFLVVEVHSSVDVSAVVFVLEATINDQELFIEPIEMPIEHSYQGLSTDARKVSRPVIRDEVLQLRNVFGFYIHDGG